jgi:hypothetical protein
MTAPRVMVLVGLFDGGPQLTATAHAPHSRQLLHFSFMVISRSQRTRQCISKGIKADQRARSRSEA